MVASGSEPSPVRVRRVNQVTAADLLLHGMSLRKGWWMNN